jgi:UPF0755 protein
LRPEPADGAPRAASPDQRVDLAPRTAAMPALGRRVPAVRPHARRSVAEPSGGDRFAEAQTEPGRSSGTGRPLPGRSRPDPGAGRPAPGGRGTPGHSAGAAVVPVRSADADLPTGDLLVGESDGPVASAADTRHPLGRRTGGALSTRHRTPQHPEPAHDRSGRGGTPEDGERAAFLHPDGAQPNALHSDGDQPDARYRDPADPGDAYPDDAHPGEAYRDEAYPGDFHPSDPGPDGPHSDDGLSEHVEPDDIHPDDRHGPVFDQTGGLEIIADDPDDDHYDDHYDDHSDDTQYDDREPAEHGAGGRPRRRGRGSGGGRRPRKRHRRLASVLSLLVLAAVLGAIVFGGQALWRTINPVADDYPGTGSGSVDVRISDGDSLRTIAGTLVDADVIASSGPFLTAAKAHPQATSIQPGIYRMNQQMSGAAALDLLLHPDTRQLSRVTIPEGMTVAQVLQRLSDDTGIPLADLQAAAADTAALGLPAYANGTLEGLLFPATYDVEPDASAVDVLRPMIARAEEALDTLQVPDAQRLTVLTKASIVQAESGSVEDMGKVARVLENRLADGMPLQLDTTVNYANGKSGVTTSPEDRANPSPYNTYAHPGLPPGPISNPGEQALEAVLAPTPGDWRFFVVVDPDTGDTRFAVTAEEHQQNVLLFQQWLRDHPNG